MQQDIITPTTPQSPGPQIVPEPVTPPTPEPPIQLPAEPPKKSKSKRKILSVTLVILAIFVSTGAFAYYLFYLPNTPKNIVKRSVENTLKKEKTSGKGVFSIKQYDSPIGTSLNYYLQADKTKNASKATGEIAFGEVKVPLEVVSIDNNIYLKLNDMSNLSALASGYWGEDLGNAIDQIGKQVSGKWIEFSQTATEGSGTGSCTSLLSNQLSQDDIDKILRVYDKNSFIDIKGVSDENVEGKSVKKIEVGLNKDKANSFGQAVAQLEIFKKLSQCDDLTKNIATNQDFANDGKVFVWVDPAKKEIAKISFEHSGQDSVATFDFTFTDEAVDIQKPQDSVSFSNFLSQLSPILNAGSPIQGQNPSTNQLQVQ